MGFLSNYVPQPEPQTLVECLAGIVARTNTPFGRRYPALPFAPAKDIEVEKSILYIEQKGRCNRCRAFFTYKKITVDHIIPKSKGGTDHIENLQLLCGHCNSVKGNRVQPMIPFGRL